MTRRHLQLGSALVAALMVSLVVPALQVAPLADAAIAHPTLSEAHQAKTYRTTGAGKVLVDIRSTYCRGFPKLRVSVDGKLDHVIRLNSRKKKTYRSKFRYAAGAHRVRFVMRADREIYNKHGDLVCDRKVRVSNVRMKRVTPGPPAAVPGDNDDAFTLAVIGDTQDEVYNNGNRNFFNRTTWLATHATSKDIRFVAQTGDITSWGWLAQTQYDVAAAAMHVLTRAGVPWQVTIGNHDTRAVGVGGSAYEATNPTECRDRFGSGCSTPVLVRHTEEFNEFFSAADYVGQSGTWPTGQVDNSFSTFRAANKRWLVLNLELWPRTEAVAWAKNVISSHPTYNVIIQTHDYLTQGGTVTGSNGGYGANSGTYVEDNLVKPYKNVKIVLSGHEGLAATNTFTYPNRNKVTAFLGNEDSKRVAVTRLIDINTKTGVISSRFWSHTANLSASPDGTTSASGFSFQ